MRVIDLSDAAETDLVAADEDLGLRGAITPVPGGGTVRVGAPTDASGIPVGTTVEVVLAPDSATLSWEAEKGVVGLTAIPRMQYDEYVEAGKIVLKD